MMRLVMSYSGENDTSSFSYCKGIQSYHEWSKRYNYFSQSSFPLTFIRFYGRRSIMALRRGHPFTTMRNGANTVGDVISSIRRMILSIKNATSENGIAFIVSRPLCPDTKTSGNTVVLGTKYIIKGVQHFCNGPRTWRSTPRFTWWRYTDPSQEAESIAWSVVNSE